MKTYLCLITLALVGRADAVNPVSRHPYSDRSAGMEN